MPNYFCTKYPNSGHSDLVITNVVLERHYGAQQLACNDKFHPDHQSQCFVFYNLQQYYDDFYECCSLVLVEPQLSGVMSVGLWNSHNVKRKWEVSNYSHLSNKREVTLTDFEKFHPPQKKIHPPQLLIS